VGTVRALRGATTVDVDEPAHITERVVALLERILDRNEKEGIAPVRVARTIVRAVEAKEPDALYAVGSNAPAVFALQRALPQSLVEGMLARKFGLSPKPVEPN